MTMLRKRRCTACGSVFYGDGTATECQNCTKTQPDLTKQLDDKAEQIRKANSSVASDTPQTLDIKKLAASADKKTKAAKDASS